MSTLSGVLTALAAPLAKKVLSALGIGFLMPNIARITNPETQKRRPGSPRRRFFFEIV